MIELGLLQTKQVPQNTSVGKEGKGEGGIGRSRVDGCYNVQYFRKPTFAHHAGI